MYENERNKYFSSVKHLNYNKSTTCITNLNNLIRIGVSTSHQVVKSLVYAIKLTSKKN